MSQCDTFVHTHLQSTCRLVFLSSLSDIRGHSGELRRGLCCTDCMVKEGEKRTGKRPCVTNWCTNPNWVSYSECPKNSPKTRIIWVYPTCLEKNIQIEAYFRISKREQRHVNIVSV